MRKIFVQVAYGCPIRNLLKPSADAPQHARAHRECRQGPPLLIWPVTVPSDCQRDFTEGRDWISVHA